MAPVSIVVVKFKSDDDTKGTKTRVSVDDKASLKALRTILTNDHIMKSGDVFEDEEQVTMSKSSEETTPWSSIAKENKTVFIRSSSSDIAQEKIPLPKYVEAPKDHADAKATLSGGASAEAQYSESKQKYFGSGVTETDSRKNVRDLDSDEIDILIGNANLGCGINPALDVENCYLQNVTKDVPQDDVVRNAIDRSRQSTTISMSAREASYAEAGWVEASVNAETPWISGGVNFSAQKSTSSSKSQSTIHVTGRWAYTKCKLSLPSSGLEPQHALKKAVEKALDRKSDEDKQKALAKVFEDYGYFYVFAVEMGGVKYTTSEEKTGNEGYQSDVKMQMSVAVSKKFGPADVGASVGGGKSTSAASNESNRFENSNFATHGGDIQLDDIDKWKQSLSDFHTWRAVRPVKIKPIVELFDDETQEKIAALLPKTSGAEESIPLYRMFNPSSGDHFYCIDESEKDRAVGSGYAFEGNMGRVLRQAKHGAVPLYRAWNGREHFYTANSDEFQNACKNIGYHDEGNAGFVFREQVKGTTALYRAYQGSSGDHFYTIKEEEYNNACNSLGFAREGIAGYVFQ